jgi:hypothetical protein
MPFSGLSRREALVRNDISEELSASIIKVTRIAELRTTLAVPSNRRKQRSVVKPYWCMDVNYGNVQARRIWTSSTDYVKNSASNCRCTRFVSNLTLHADFKIPPVRNAIQGKMHNHRSRIEVHSNPLLRLLLQVHNNRDLRELGLQMWSVNNARWRHWMSTRPR